MQRRPAVVVDSIDDRATTYQQRNDACTVVERRRMKCSDANVRHSVQIGAAIEQQLDDVDVTPMQCQLQRSPVVLILGLNLGAIFEHEANDVDAIVQRSRHQWRPARRRA